MRRAAAVVAGLAACTGAKPAAIAPAGDSAVLHTRDLRPVMKAELEDEILTSYERDEPPDVDTAMLDPRIGPARIGVGPGDVLIGPDLARAPSRWPLDLDPRTVTEARSKRLEVHLAQDGTAAWAFDEISWRLHLCGHVAAIPLRMTSLFAREGDRWVQVFEHLSFGHVPAPSRDGLLRGAAIASAAASPGLTKDLGNALAAGQLRPQRDPSVVSTGPEATIIGPDVFDEWHATEVIASGLAELNLSVEDRRVGTVGRTPGAATIAYWVGNLVASLPARPGIAAGKARVRGTFVFERRRLVQVDVDTKRRRRGRDETQSCAQDATDCRWVLVQGHVSHPIDDGPDPSGERTDIVDLATLVFGTSLISPKPLEVTCDDGGPVRAPAKAAPALSPVRAPAPPPSRPPPGGGSR